MESVRVRASLIKAKMKPVSPEASFADWVSNRFGQHLYYKYFKPYMEKLWGIPCEELGVDAAEMRLDGISLIDAFDEKVAGASSVASPRKFHYPKLGPGQMWEGAANRIFEKFGTIFFDRKVQTIHWDETGVTHITGTNQAGEFFQQEGTNFLSSLPLKELLLSLDPPPPKEVAEAARSLRHRSIVTVCLVVSREEVFPDHWIYVPDPSVKLVRIQNYKNWSVAMVPDRKLTSLGCEYFCEEGDNMWASSDYDLAQVAIRDVVKIGLVKEAEIKDAFVVRTPRALPIHDKQTKEHLKTIREWVSLFANLQPLGRNGLHCGANQDHAMMTAMYAVKNIQGGDFDCWKVTPDARYPQDSQT
jgi:protoporphyrinogen oxidase